MAIIEVNHVTKEYKLGQLTSLKQTALNSLNRLTGRPVIESKPFKAIDDVTFSIEQGEVLGIIGHNGAGKSTMLKLLANISKPTSGNITVNGKVAPLIEVGAGLIGDLTGRENIYLNGAILGIPKAEIARKFDEIVAFAELEEFIYTPIKRYSSGMTVRLGFAIATSVESDILIVDEVLAVGDLAFQRKCFERVEELIKRQGRTVLIVSHNLRQIERICKRVILMDHGKVLADGDAPSICNQCYELNDTKIKNQSARSDNCLSSTGDIELLNIKAVDESGKETDAIEYNTSPTFIIRVKVNNALPKPSFVFGIHTIDFFYISTSVCPNTLMPEILEPGMHTVALQIDKFPFINGAFSIRIRIETGEIGKIVFYGENLYHFRATKLGLVRSRLEAEGIAFLPITWNVQHNSHALNAVSPPDTAGTGV